MIIRPTGCGTRSQPNLAVLSKSSQSRFDETALCYTKVAVTVDCDDQCSLRSELRTLSCDNGW
ncbi:hypothetical protein BDV38DRAFT_258456 [Aspergillus pseudotamarii]|uniref:Uncharacterized protein n=1 Tax=Aspergillus pseudotamarii TaxID=132259 RepID=A0A5N6SJY7_ASPPS|nr:uncharacterized protein BDV38DRAFT_258456 [Aspergillus pseudotamarii]KAE8133424.1 hypothetical protein BDV38DRAFT_258456 [Aspergillus pseudotamarii]